MGLHFKAGIICLFILLAALSSLQAATLHTILIGVYDEDNSRLASAVTNDLQIMKDEAQRIAEATGLNVCETLLLASSLDAKDVLDAIDSCQVFGDDILIFYYSGHGFTTDSYEEDPWPILGLTPYGPSACSLKLIDISDKLAKKNARFTFVFADCCNTWLPPNIAPPIVEFTYEDKLEFKIAENYKELFLNRPGFVILASSKRKQQAISISLGSFCTLSFLKALKESSLKQGPVTWQSVLANTAAGVAKLLDEHLYENSFRKAKKKQEPIYYIQPFTPL